MSAGEGQRQRGRPLHLPSALAHADGRSNPLSCSDAVLGGRAGVPGWLCEASNHMAPRKECRCPLAREGREKGGGTRLARRECILSEDLLPTSGDGASTVRRVTGASLIKDNCKCDVLPSPLASLLRHILEAVSLAQSSAEGHRSEGSAMPLEPRWALLAPTTWSDLGAPPSKPVPAPVFRGSGVFED